MAEITRAKRTATIRVALVATVIRYRASGCPDPTDAAAKAKHLLLTFFL